MSKVRGSYQSLYQDRDDYGKDNKGAAYIVHESDLDFHVDIKVDAELNVEVNADAICVIDDHTDDGGDNERR